MAPSPARKWYLEMDEMGLSPEDYAHLFDAETNLVMQKRREGLSNKQVGELLGKTTDQARMIEVRAIRKMRKTRRLLGLYIKRCSGKIFITEE